MEEKNGFKGLLWTESFWALGGVVLAWVVLITQVRHHWGGESYYNFGWFVPFMAIWLLLRNLAQLETGPAGRWRSGLYLALTFLFLIPVIPFHALSEVNPFWRLPLWIQALGISGFTLLMLHYLYGWAGVRAGLFPVFFLTTMIPWPYRFEVWMVQSLTGVVVDLSIQGLHFLGYPVEAAGNSLVLDEIRVGVNEACSGIRSLQALFMVSLFLGSLFSQSWIRRLLVLTVLPLIVIVVNAFRAVFLSTQVIVKGNDAYDRWHDPAGYIAFGISMVLIYAAIELLNIGSDSGNATKPVDGGKLLNQWKAFAQSRQAVWFVLAPAIVYLTVEAWFRVHEWQDPPKRDWEMQLPSENDSGYVYSEIAPYVQNALGYSYGTHFSHRLNSQVVADVYYYGFTEDNKLSSVSSYGHAPTICMEASGAVLLRALPLESITVGQIEIPVRHYLFEIPRTDSRVNVFWIVWENRNMDIEPEQLAELNYKTQLIQLMRGRRDFSRKVLLLSLSGLEEPEAARRQAMELFSDWIIPAGD